MWVNVLVGLLMVVGLLGSFLPFLPGTPLILAGAVVYAVATDFEVIGVGRLLILTALTILAYALDYLAGALGAKKVGASGWAVAGALLGALIGLFFGPLGLLLGPILGAIGGEMMRSGQWKESVRSGGGALLGMVVGTAAKLFIAVVMVALFLWWVRTV